MKNLSRFSFSFLLALGIGLTAPQWVSAGESADAVAAESQSFSEYQAVLKALQPYIDGAKKGDGTLIRSRFFDHARVVGSVHGEMEKSTPKEFGAVIDDLGPADGLKHHVAWIDISGPAAAAKIEFQNWGGFRFTDFFVLYKVDGEWKVSGKVYDAHSNN